MGDTDEVERHFQDVLSRVHARLEAERSTPPQRSHEAESPRHVEVVFGGTALSLAEPAPVDGALPRVATPVANAVTTTVDRTRLDRLKAAAAASESVGLGYHLGAAVERIFVASGDGGKGIELFREAIWLIERYMAIVEERPVGADLHASTMRSQPTFEMIESVRSLSQPTGGESGPAQPSISILNGGSVAAQVNASDARADDAYDPPLGREILLMVVRWSLIIIVIVMVVLALTVIGELR